MTAGQLFESVFAKGCCVRGSLMTADLDFDVDSESAQLQQLGFSLNGCEQFCDPFTGKAFLAKVFVGEYCCC